MGTQQTYNQSLAARAAAILTTSEVDCSTLNLNNYVRDQMVNVELAFTIGSLTNVILRLYASMDGSTWIPIPLLDGATTSKTITASTTQAFGVAPFGYNFFKASLQGTGTVTSSSATVTYRWRRTGT